MHVAAPERRNKKRSKERCGGRERESRGIEWEREERERNRARRGGEPDKEQRAGFYWVPPEGLQRPRFKWSTLTLCTTGE